MSDDEKLARNERLKLSAISLNGVAIAVIATGLVAPCFAFLYGLSAVSADQVRFFGLAAPGWVLMGAFIHDGARLLLGGLRA